MSQAESQEVQNYLQRTVLAGETPEDQKLVFDPTTGELVVQQKNAKLPNPDAVVADNIAEEGFFWRNFFCGDIQKNYIA
ncbi:MAG: hypothetical protein ACKO3K_14180 [Cuspidothrix sp.]